MKDAREGVMALETSVPGVFAIGDVRSGSTKRVAAAVGEGAAVVSQIHGLLAKREALACRRDTRCASAGIQGVVVRRSRSGSGASESAR